MYIIDIVIHHISKIFNMEPHHSHQSTSHLIHPYMSTTTSKAMDQNFSGKTIIEPLLRPVKRIWDVVEWHFCWRSTTSSSTPSRIQEKFRTNLIWIRRQHVQIAERSRWIETSNFWVADALNIFSLESSKKIFILNQSTRIIYYLKNLSNF